MTQSQNTHYFTWKKNEIKEANLMLLTHCNLFVHANCLSNLEAICDFQVKNWIENLRERIISPDLLNQIKIQHQKSLLIFR